MIGALIGILLLVIVTGVIFWGLQQLLPLIPLEPPFRVIVHVIMVLILVLVVVYIVLVLLSSVGVNVPIFRP
jgi:hypothetical protein